MLSLVFAAVIASSMPASSHGSKSNIPPWAWSDEERIAARTNPVLARVRAEAAQPSLRGQHVKPLSADARARTVDVIDGTREPEYSCQRKSSSV